MISYDIERQIVTFLSRSTNSCWYLILSKSSSDLDVSSLDPVTSSANISSEFFECLYAFCNLKLKYKHDQCLNGNAIS